MDLSGKLIIKAQLGEDIRRVPIHNEDMTYDELVLMMQRVFRGCLNPEDELTIKYKDEDGDLITIFDSADVAFAIQCCHVLRLTLFVNGKTTTSSLCDNMSVYTIRQELRHIRDRVTSLLDCLDLNASAKTQVDDAKSGSHMFKVSDGNNAVSGTPALAHQSMINNPPKEFDPLSENKQSVEAAQDAAKPGPPSENASQNGSNSASSTPAPTSISSISPSHAPAHPKSTSSNLPQQSQTNYSAYNQGPAANAPRPPLPSVMYSHPHPYVYHYGGYGSYNAPAAGAQVTQRGPAPNIQGPTSMTPQYHHSGQGYQGWM